MQAGWRRKHMKAVGIVCEYNPFHLGHFHHLNKVHEYFGEEAVIICALSGDFVQRGEPSVFSKFARAEAALRCGADIVVELPSVWALQSAEGYAASALAILSALEISSLSFGVETSDFSGLKEIAELLSSENFEEALSAAVKDENGRSYPSVREEVLRRFLGNKAEFLKQPNNILAIEYLKASIKNSYGFRFLPVQRTGAVHDGVSSGPIRSASEIRSMILNGEDVSAYVPQESYRIIRREILNGRGPVAQKTIEQALLSRLRVMKAADFLKVKDCDEELSQRIESAVAGNYALADIFASVKTRKYTLSRIRRVCLCAALGISEEMQRKTPPYIRILAADSSGRAFLKQLKKSGSRIPLAVKAADILKTGDAGREAILTDSAIHDIYVLGYTSPEEMICGMDFRHSPVML